MKAQENQITQDNAWQQIHQEDHDRMRMGASRTQDCFYSQFSYIQTVVRRKNAMKVKVAVARKMLVAVWHVLNEGVPYRDYKMLQAQAGGNS